MMSSNFLDVSCSYVARADVFVFMAWILGVMLVACIASLWGVWSSVVKLFVLIAILAFWYWLPYDAFYDNHPSLVCSPGRYRYFPVPGLVVSLVFMFTAILFNRWDSGKVESIMPDRIVRYVTWSLMATFFGFTMYNTVVFPFGVKEYSLFWVAVLVFFLFLCCLGFVWKRYNLDEWFLRRLSVSSVCLVLWSIVIVFW